MDKIQLAQQEFVRLPLEGVVNCRDLGGYYSDKNKVTAWRTFLRSSRLNNMTDQDISFLKSYGVHTVIDLRSDHEIESLENAKGLEDNFDVINVDLIGDVARASQEAGLEEHANDPLVLGRMYTRLLDKKDSIIKTIDIILEHKDKGGILFHCTAGKDRTGVIAMLLLGLAGISKQDIITNYEVSATNIKSIANKELSEFLPNVLGSAPENIIMAYDFVMDNYSSFEAYFSELGYSKEQQESLISHFIKG